MYSPGIAQPYKLLDKYPGIRPRDEVVWDSFIMANPTAFERVWYNVHIGDPALTDDERDHMRRTGMYDVSQWLVDVVAQVDDKFYVIEVKPNAGAGALGQAQAYAKILEAEGKLPAGSIPMVVTDAASPITFHAAKLLGVMLCIP